MANYLLQTLIPLLSSIALLLAAATSVESQSTSFAYDFTGEIVPSLFYHGDAHFPSDTPHLRLTKTNATGYPETNSFGRVLYNGIVTLAAPGVVADFETTIKFIITPVDDSPADGITFFIVPTNNRFPTDAYGSNLGIFGSEIISLNTVAVEFDVHSNDGIDTSDLPHIEIDFAIPSSKNVTAVGNALVGQEVTARINYVGATQLLTARVTVGSESFEVSYVTNLGTGLVQQFQVGISGATGGNVALHDIISWYFTSTLVNTGGSDAKIRQVVA